MWLWSQQDPQIHTLVVGAARPSDLDLHAEAAKRFARLGLQKNKQEKEQCEGQEGDGVQRVERRLMAAYDAVWGEMGWKEDWWIGLPDCYQVKREEGSVRQWGCCCMV